MSAPTNPVELSKLENRLLREAFKLFVGLLTNRQHMVRDGFTDAQECMRRLGPTGAAFLGQKMEAHYASTEDA
jgi:hypothetical protein